MKKKNVTIKSLFESTQSSMISNLNKKLLHSVEKGDSTEEAWMSWLKEYLPSRYDVCKGHIIDSNGNYSDQIDIIIFDKFYSPLVLVDKTFKYVTAESVYAIFECKQELNSRYIKDAIKHSVSVKKLVRTNIRINQMSGISQAKNIEHKIITGILTTKTKWKDCKKNLNKIGNKGELDIICCVEEYVCTKYEKFEERECILKNETLIFLFIRLLKFLQEMGNPPAINIDLYNK